MNTTPDLSGLLEQAEALNAVESDPKAPRPASVPRRKSSGRPVTANDSRISKLMVKYGISATEIYRRFGIPRPTINSWKAGDRDCPDYVFNMLEACLDHDIYPIIGKDTDPERKDPDND